MIPTREMTQTRWLSAPVTQLEALVGDRPILILAPHADDETIGCAGLICQAVRAGIPVSIEFLTDGSRSHRASKTYDRTRLAALRKAEALKAVGCLGVDTTSVNFWTEEDSMLAANDDIDTLVTALRKRILETNAGSIFVTWIDDPHCDHKAAFRLALQSLAHLESPPCLYAYPVWSWTIQTERSAYEGSVVRLAIEANLATKHEALSCHASQLGKLITDDPDGFSLNAAQLALFMQPFETFITVAFPT